MLATLLLQKQQWLLLTPNTIEGVAFGPLLNNNMTLGHGLAMGIIGCTITIIGFFIAFLVVNHNKKKELKKIEDKKNRIQGSYYGDDTV